MNRYAKSRPLRTFEIYGRVFQVVRWKNENGKPWRGYTALLHNGRCVASDISRNCDDSVETWEASLARRFRDAASLEAAFAALGDREAS